MLLLKPVVVVVQNVAPVAHVVFSAVVTVVVAADVDVLEHVAYVVFASVVTVVVVADVAILIGLKKRLVEVKFGGCVVQHTRESEQR